MKHFITYLFFTVFAIGVNGQNYMQKFKELHPVEDLIFENKYDESIVILDSKIREWETIKDEKYFSAILPSTLRFILFFLCS